MQLHMCTARAAWQLLGVSLMFARFALLCAQGTEYLRAGDVSAMRSYSEYAPSYSNNKQRQAMPANDGENDADDGSVKMVNYEAIHGQKRRNEQMQQAPKQHIPSNNWEPQTHKCRQWVPTEAVSKYKDARETNTMDQNRQQSQIEVCCKGFVPLRWKGITKCLPYCERCSNGICRAPDECECYDGFVKNDDDECVFSCPLGCLNGRCYLDGTCQCDPGYKLDETRKFCRPICSDGCDVAAGHNCTAPEVCGCAKGFQLKRNGCQPVCDPDCGKGGTCYENNICTCGQGYKMKNDICQAECYQSCEDGVCVAPNRCICKPHYRYHEHSTMCIPSD